MKFVLLDKKEYANFESENVYGNFMQTAERAELRERMGFHCFLTGVKDGEKVLAAGLLVEKNGEVWIQIGPILDWENTKLVKFFIEKCVDFCWKHNFVEIEIFPPIVLSVWSDKGEKTKSFDWQKLFEIFKSYGFKHMGFTTKTEYKAMRWMFVKDLKELKTMRDIELTFNPTKRNRYHRALKELDIYQLQKKSELSDWIKSLLDSDARNGLNTRKIKYFEDLWDCFGDKAMFLEARKKETGEIVASEIDIWHRNELVTFLGGIPAKFRRENGMPAIRGWQMEEALKRDVKRVNMYGVEGEFSKDNLLLMTKSEYGGVVEEYIGGFKKVLRPGRYYFGKVWRKVSRIFH